METTINRIALRDIKAGELVQDKDVRVLTTAEAKLESLERRVSKLESAMHYYVYGYPSAQRQDVRV